MRLLLSNIVQSVGWTGATQVTMLCCCSSCSWLQARGVEPCREQVSRLSRSARQHRCLQIRRQGPPAALVSSCSCGACLVQACAEIASTACSAFCANASKCLLWVLEGSCHKHMCIPICLVQLATSAAVILKLARTVKFSLLEEQIIECMILNYLLNYLFYFLFEKSVAPNTSRQCQ